jgi:hypothetical protein
MPARSASPEDAAGRRTSVAVGMTLFQARAARRRTIAITTTRTTMPTPPPYRLMPGI